MASIGATIGASIVLCEGCKEPGDLILVEHESHPSHRVHDVCMRNLMNLDTEDRLNSECPLCARQIVQINGQSIHEFLGPLSESEEEEEEDAVPPAGAPGAATEHMETEEENHPEPNSAPAEPQTAPDGDVHMANGSTGN